MLESSARVPGQDRLAIIDGLATSYPNLFFEVPEDRLPDFLRELNGVNSAVSAQAFIKSWGIAEDKSKLLGGLGPAARLSADSSIRSSTA